MQNISSVFCYVGVLVLHISAQQMLTTFTFPLTSRSVNGSSATGNCTGAAMLSDIIYQCDDPISSVVYDGHIPTLTGLDGNMWASQLLTIQNASSAVLVFNFTGTPNFQVMRVEMVVFNCPQWGISLQSVVLTGSDLTQLGAVNPAISSCDFLVRVCIPNLSITSPQAVLRLKFTTLERTDWIHIAEVGFYGNSGTCPPETFIPELATTTISTDTADTATNTSDIMNLPKENSAEVAVGVAAGVIFFVMATIVVVIIAIAVICLKTKKGKVCFQRLTVKSHGDRTNKAESSNTIDANDIIGEPESTGRTYYTVDHILHNKSGCVQSSVNQDEAYDKPGETGQNKPHVHVDETHKAYSQLEHSNRKLTSVSKADNPEQHEMYAVVNKPKQHKPPSQSNQSLTQEYAVVNKDFKRRKFSSQPTQPPGQEYAVVNKNRPPEVPTKSKDLAEELERDQT